MKLENIYINLSKCTEKQQKHIFSLLPEPINEEDYMIFDSFYNLHSDNERWYCGSSWVSIAKTELTYPEFIKLFEEPKKLPSELLKEYFKNTPREQVLNDWESTAYLDNTNSPKIIELFEGEHGETEFDIEKLAKESLKFQHKNIQDRMIYVLGFEEGFKKAMEINSKQ